MIKNVIFDMDGVLLDSETGIRTACMEMFKRYGVQAKHEDFVPFTGMGENRFIGGVAQKYGVPFVEEMKTQAYAIYESIAEEYVVVYEGIRDLILELKKRGFKIAVASSADAVKVKVNLKCMGLQAEDFGAVITGTDVVRNKPFPDVFLLAAEKIGADPAQSLVVEDAVSGCQAAKAAGMACIGVTSTFPAEKLSEAGADHIVSRTVDILPILETM